MSVNGLGWLRALLPQPCPGCGAGLGARAGLCQVCLGALHAEVLSHSPLTRVASPHLVSLGRYAGPLRRAVRALKYGGSREVAGALGARLAAGVPPAWAPQAVCAVPLHAGRERRRGYNQAELLARALAAELKVPCRPLLRRTRATRQQARLHADERRANLEGAFEATGRAPLRVLLVDDVLTTGSTLTECERVLRAAGAERVFFAVAAH